MEGPLPWLPPAGAPWVGAELLVIGASETTCSVRAGNHSGWKWAGMCQNQESGTHPPLPLERQGVSREGSHGGEGDKSGQGCELLEGGTPMTSPRTWQRASQDEGWTAGRTHSPSSQGAQWLFQLLLPPWAPSPSPRTLVLMPGLQPAGDGPSIKPHADG